MSVSVSSDREHRHVPRAALVISVTGMAMAEAMRAKRIAMMMLRRCILRLVGSGAGRLRYPLCW